MYFGAIFTAIASIMLSLLQLVMKALSQLMSLVELTTKRLPCNGIANVARPLSHHRSVENGDVDR